MKKLFVLFLLLYIASAGAQVPPKISVEDALKQIQALKLNEVDNFIENYAQGMIDIEGDQHNDHLFSSISEVVHKIPRMLEIKKQVVVQNPVLKEFFEKPINNVAELIFIYASASLILDSPRDFEKKYKNYLNHWRLIGERDASSRDMVLINLAFFQDNAIFFNKIAQTSIEYTEELYNLNQKYGESLNEKFWEFSIQILSETNLRLIPSDTQRVSKKQEYLLHRSIEKGLVELSSNPDAQYRFLTKLIKPVISGRYNISFKGYESYFDIILNHRNSDNVEDQTQILAEYFDNRIQWELTISPGEYIRRTRAITNSCNVNFDECKAAKAFILPVLNKYYRRTGQFEKADSILREFTEIATNAYPKLDAFSKVLAQVNELNALMDKGELGSAELIVNNIRWLTSDRSNFSDLDDELYFQLWITTEERCLQYELMVGKFEQVISRAHSSLSLIELYIHKNSSAERILVEKREKLQTIIDQAHIKIAKTIGTENKKEIREEIIKIDTNSDGAYLMAKFWSVFFAKDFVDAYKIASLLVSNEQRDQDLALLPPSAYAIKVTRGLKELAEEHLILSEVDHTKVRQFYADISTDYEMSYYQKAYISKDDELSFFSGLWGVYSLLDEKNYAAFYAKRYVNLLQAIRADLHNNKSSSLSSFTDIYKENLQKMSLTLYDVGDLSGAISILEIIKENELQDFTSSGDRSVIPTTLLTFSATEKSFFSTIGSLDAEYKSLAVLYLNAQIQATKYDISQLKSALIVISNEIEKNLKKLRQTLSSAQLESTTQSELILNSVYPVLQAVVAPNETFFYLTIDGKTEQFVIPLHKDELRLHVYKLYASVTNKSNDWRQSAEILNELLFLKVIARLEEKSIKKFYFVADDALTFLPLDLLLNDANKKIEVINLVTTKGLNNRDRVVSDSRLEAFGATKGNSLFKPLPAAKEEVNFLSQYKFKKATAGLVQKGHLDEKFTLISLQQSLTNRTEIVHIASHFNASGATDLDNGLLMGDGSFVSVKRLLQSKQSFAGVELLTLSACETALSSSNMASSARSFDGLASLFVGKGVAQVLATLWKISDESTASFMKVFYLYRQSEGLSSSEALSVTKRLFQEASPEQIKYLKKKYPILFTDRFTASIRKYSHPYYWAGFVLTSNGQ